MAGRSAAGAAPVSRRMPCRGLPLRAETTRGARSRAFDFLLEPLALPHRGVQPSPLDELAVRSALGDSPFFENDDLIRVPERGEAVRDQERRPAGHDVAEAALDSRFGLGVDRRK